MTLKDMLDVFGNIDVCVYRGKFNYTTDDWDWDDVYDGSFKKMPKDIYGLTVVEAEPNANGLCITVD